MVSFRATTSSQVRSGTSIDDSRVRLRSIDPDPTMLLTVSRDHERGGASLDLAWTSRPNPRILTGSRRVELLAWASSNAALNFTASGEYVGSKVTKLYLDDEAPSRSVFPKRMARVTIEGKPSAESATLYTQLRSEPELGWSLISGVRSWSAQTLNVLSLLICARILPESRALSNLTTPVPRSFHSDLVLSKRKSLARILKRTSASSSYVLTGTFSPSMMNGSYKEALSFQTTPCSFKNTLQRLHNGFPSASLCQRGVFVVWQFVHTVGNPSCNVIVSDCTAKYAVQKARKSTRCFCAQA